MQDILREVYTYVLKLKFPEDVKIYLCEQLAEIEYRLSIGTSEKIQLSSLIGCFQLVKEAVANKKPLKDYLQPAIIE